MRSILKRLPDPGPMPDNLVRRIASRLDDERRAEQEASVYTLPSPGYRPPSRGVITGLAVAATVAAISGVIAVDALRDLGTPSVVASLAGPLAHHRTVGASGVAYSEKHLPEQAVEGIERLRRSGASTSAARLGVFGTSSGLDACLADLGLDNADGVSVDVSTFDARPAAIISATEHGSHTARVVSMSCGPGHTEVVRAPVPIP